MENMCMIIFWFILGARGINKKSEETNSASMGKFGSTGHVSTNNSFHDTPLLPALMYVHPVYTLRLQHGTSLKQFIKTKLSSALQSCLLELPLGFIL